MFYKISSCVLLVLTIALAATCYVLWQKASAAEAANEHFHALFMQDAPEQQRNFELAKRYLGRFVYNLKVDGFDGDFSDNSSSVMPSYRAMMDELFAAYEQFYKSDQPVNGALLCAAINELSDHSFCAEPGQKPFGDFCLAMSEKNMNDHDPCDWWYRWHKQ